jgi:ornithine--oxo-acid transaminase
MKTRQYIQLEEQYGAHNYHPLDVVIQKAKGVWVYDVEGRKYLDCLAAYSAVNQGHCHPKILAAFVRQAKRVTLTSRAFRNDQLPLLYKALHDMTGYEMSLPMNSGAEAVETAVKAARKWGYKVKGIPEDRAEILCCSDNFHGRTTTIVSFSTDAQYRDGFGPFTPGFRIVRYGDIEDLKRAITPNTAAFLVEPIQGESGIVAPPEGYLHAAAELCRENNVLLVVDEIQSGLGRTGKLFAFEHEKVRPDMVIIGKALAGGFYPVSAVLGSKEILGVFRPGDHGSIRGKPARRSNSHRRSQGDTDREARAAFADAGRLLQEAARGNQESPHQAGERAWALDRTGAGHEGTTVLRGIDEEGSPLQGNTRECHPVCSAARHQEIGGPVGV